MKKIFLISLIISAAINAFAQTDSFDVFNYKAPEFFTKSELPSAVQFSMMGSDGNFCTITLYKSLPAKKDITSDVNSQWSEQVVKRLTKANKKPAKTMMGKQWEGWASTVAIGNFYQNKKKCVVMLQSFRKDTTTVCVVFGFSDPLFKSAVEDFSKNLHLKDQK